MREQVCDIAIDLSEAVLDSLTDDELVKGIPVIGTVVNVIKLSGSISDRLFAAQLQRFLVESNDVTQAQRAAFLEELATDPKRQARAGQLVALSIEKAGELETAAMIGALTARLIAKDVEFDEYRRMLHAVDATFLDDLKYFIELDPDSVCEAGGVAEQLATTGLSEQVVHTFDEIRPGAPLLFTFTKTNLGIRFSTFLRKFAENAEPKDAGERG